MLYIMSQVLFEAQALGNFEAEEEEDLSFKEREILTILESSRDDGWLLAENALGERGLVPGNYVRVSEMKLMTNLKSSFFSISASRAN